MLSPVPFRNKLFTKEGLIDQIHWVPWLNKLVAGVNATEQQAGTVALTAQVASITTTAVPIQKLTAGLYRLSYYMRKTVAASVSSSLTVTLGWTDGGVALTQAFAALTTNTTAAFQQDSILIRSDADPASISYAVLYASSGTAMQYRFSLSVEAVPA